MIFFFGNSDSNKKKKKLRQKLREEMCRRAHMIIEAQSKHKANRKALEKSLSIGGYTEVKTMEEQDIGIAVSSAITKTLAKGGKALDKVKKRQKKLENSKKSHLARLQKARGQMMQRQRA